MKKIIEDTKNFFGNVLCIGITDENILAPLRKKNNLNVFTIDYLPNKGIFSRRKKIKTKDGKKVNIKKLRKTFKTKSIDFMICNLNEIYSYFKYFIGDSVIVNRGILYIYGTSSYIDPKVLASRYKRYGAVVEIEIDNDNFLLIVNNKHSKTNWFKNRFLIFIDTFHNIGDMISTALIS